MNRLYFLLTAFSNNRGFIQKCRSFIFKSLLVSFMQCQACASARRLQKWRDGRKEAFSSQLPQQVKSIPHSKPHDGMRLLVSSQNVVPLLTQLRLRSLGYSTTFPFCSNKVQVVVQYPTTEILTAHHEGSFHLRSKLSTSQASSRLGPLSLRSIRVSRLSGSNDLPVLSGRCFLVLRIKLFLACLTGIILPLV